MTAFRYSVVRRDGTLFRSDLMEKIESRVQYDWPGAEPEPTRTTDYYEFTVYRVDGKFACIVTCQLHKYTRRTHPITWSAE